MKRAMVTTLLSGWPNNPFATPKWPCGAVPTPVLTNGRQQKNFRRISAQSCQPPPHIRRSMVPVRIIASAEPTVYNGLRSSAATSCSKISSLTKNSGGRNSSTPTKNTLHSRHSIRSSEIHRSIFQRILKHPSVDAYYDAMMPTIEQYKKLTLPILTITGQYDGDQLGALTYYRDHIANASPKVRAKHFLIIGPWDHAGTRTPTAEVGGVKFGPGAIVDLNDLHRQWYDWTLKNGPKPEFLKNQVAYYLLAPGNSGANGEWKYADSFEALMAVSRTFYLDSKNGDANGVFRSGTLTEKKPSEGADQYVYDPLDTSRGENVEGVEPNEKTAAIDQRFPLSIGKDGLVYHTDPLPAETPLIGCPKLSLWISIDTPDTDFEADLYEIQPDGTSIALWSDVRRLRYRESFREQKLVKPGEIVKCDFNPGLFVARRLMKGSRLRLIVSSPNSIFWQKNYNSGGVVADETMKDARVAHVKVYHDAAHTSAIELPLR
jgi:uncharacterized protein